MAVVRILCEYFQLGIVKSFSRKHQLQECQIGKRRIVIKAPERCTWHPFLFALQKYVPYSVSAYAFISYVRDK